MMSQVPINDLLPNQVQLRRCPYNPAHLVTMQRLYQHLKNCKNQFPNPRLRHCQFDFRHVVDKDEISAHESECPENLNIEIRHVAAPSPQLPVVSLNQKKKITAGKGKKIEVDDEENWDDDDAEKFPHYTRRFPKNKVSK